MLLSLVIIRFLLAVYFITTRSVDISNIFRNRSEFVKFLLPSDVMINLTNEKSLMRYKRIEIRTTRVLISATLIRKLSVLNNIRLSKHAQLDAKSAHSV